ncbi:hypothetical protein QTO34_018855 [Cnephaeus nilssonii]|uniref:Peptidase A2 domain-containing protein n=1 Tax=Cnephaeus nilssonii TaxID=3371016 RepID=A0AA40LQH4_CNENI|nr:hypothetical protein QTO34_018855 [Eptesicus nilssonii]
MLRALYFGKMPVCRDCGSEAEAIQAFSSQEISSCERREGPPEGAGGSPSQQEPRVTLQVGGKPVSFLVDTGAAYSVLTEPMGPVTSKKTSVQGATGQISCFPWTSKRTVDLERTR